MIYFLFVVNYSLARFIHDCSCINLVIFFLTFNVLRLKKKVNATECRGRTPLHYAAQRGAASGIQSLLDFGADPNVVDAKGATVMLLLGGHFLTKGRGRMKG